MKCPVCGESRVQWKKEFWGNRTEQFWSPKKKVMFLCGSLYIVDEKTNSYEEVKPCVRGNETAK